MRTTMIVLLMLAAAVPSNARTPTQSEMHATLMTTNERYRLCSIAQGITSRTPPDLMRSLSTVPRMNGRPQISAGGILWA